MTDQKLDNLMGKILLDSIKLECANDHEICPDFDGSKRYHHQMQSMLKNPSSWAKKRSRPLWKNVLQRVAIALLVISIGFSSVMAVSPTARAAVIRWVKEWYETYIVYRYSGENLDGEMPNYGISCLSEGYVESDRIISDLAVSVLYENEAGGIVCFDYNYLQQGVGTIVVTENNKIVDIKINRMAGQLHIPNDPEGMPSVTWIDEHANMQFVIIANCDPETLIHMAESIYEIN